MSEFLSKLSVFIVLAAFIFASFLPLLVKAQTIQTTEENFLRAKIQLLQLQIELLKTRIALLLRNAKAEAIAFVYQAQNCAQLIIAWGNVPGATGYRLYRNNALIYEGNATGFVDSGLAPARKYKYVVYGLRDGVQGGPSEVKEITAPDVCPPQFPKLNSASEPCGGNITLTWTPSPTASIYQVFRGNSEIYLGSLNRAVDFGLIPNRYYEYKIRAGNQSGWSDFSAPVSFPASNICAPSAPQVYWVIPKTDKEGMLSVVMSYLSYNNVIVRPDREIDSGYSGLEWLNVAGGYTSVMVFDAKAALSDITVTRVDLFFDTRPWLYLDKVKLGLGYYLSVEKEIAQESVTEIEVGNIYQVRFDGLNILIPEGQSSSFTVMVDPKESSTGPLPRDINVFLENKSVRGVDRAGIQQLAPVSMGGKGGVFSRTFRIE